MDTGKKGRGRTKSSSACDTITAQNDISKDTVNGEDVKMPEKQPDEPEKSSNKDDENNPQSSEDKGEEKSEVGKDKLTKSRKRKASELKSGDEGEPLNEVSKIAKEKESDTDKSKGVSKDDVDSNDKENVKEADNNKEESKNVEVKDDKKNDAAKGSDAEMKSADKEKVEVPPSNDQTDIDDPAKQLFGKGKRARIPNKRYSDILLTPTGKPSSNLSRSFIENGEKRDSEKIESEDAGSPAVSTLKSRVSTGSPFAKKPKLSIDLNNPNFLKPFKFGWKRELVYRATSDNTSKRNGDIYYYTPSGKKVRSMREVSEHLDSSSELKLEDFTFFKEPLGLDDPEKEIIRDAKIKLGSGSGGSASFVKKSLTPKLAKTPKPKVSTGTPATPKSPPMSASVATPGTPTLKALPRAKTPTAKAQANSKTAASPKAAASPKSATSPKASTTSPAHVSSENSVKEEQPSPAPTPSKTKTPAKLGNFKIKPPAAKKVDKKKSTEESMEIEAGPSSKWSGKKTGKWAKKENQAKLAPKKKLSARLNSSSLLSTDKKTEDSKFMDNYLQHLAYGYNTLLYVFQYLKVQDLLKAGCVCTMWRDVSSHPLLWRTVRLKNSTVHSFKGLANTLEKHGTAHLDLRKMILPQSVGDSMWPEFNRHIGQVTTLRKIELCRCPAKVIEDLAVSNPQLGIVNAVAIRCETMSVENLSNFTNLRELRLKSLSGFTLTSDLDALQNLKALRHLSLTSVRDLSKLNLGVIAELTNLDSLDLGECMDFPASFGYDVLVKLPKLEKLRLEKGQGNCHTFEILDAIKDMPKLEQLELVNFDIKAGFDKAMGSCTNIKRLLIIPTYISQSATTNHMVLGGVLRLQKTLSHFVWGVTLELLRVTELFVDQCEEPEKKERKREEKEKDKDKKQTTNGDSIPVLKPVPLISDKESEIQPAHDPPQVEILPLPNLQKLLLQSLPTTRVKILKIPFHATWRQSITDSVN